MVKYTSYPHYQSQFSENLDAFIPQMLVMFLLCHLIPFQIRYMLLISVKCDRSRSLSWQNPRFDERLCRWNAIFICVSLSIASSYCQHSRRVSSNTSVCCTWRKNRLDRCVSLLCIHALNWANLFCLNLWAIWMWLCALKSCCDGWTSSRFKCLRKEKKCRASCYILIAFIQRKWMEICSEWWVQYSIWLSIVVS